ncbi:MAG: type II secretion system protein GspM, partial [Marinobacter sp.]
MFQRLKDQPAIEKLIARYDQLPQRDRQALTVLLIALAIAVLYFAIWRPVSEYR